MENTPAPKPMASRERKEASKQLGIALQAKYRALLEATGEKEVSLAAVNLGALFNQNIESIIWFLKEYGGVKQMPLPRQNKRPAPPPAPANDLPTTPAIFAKPACTCPPIEAGIIGGNRHMTACPQFEPAD